MGKRVQRKRWSKRGIVGIEAAIVLIAFVVIAAALAYVVINMGFYASQTAKTTINNGINEATSALELDGFMTGFTDPNGNVTYLAVPVKLAVGEQRVDLSLNTTMVALQDGNSSLADIYSGAVNTTDTNMADLFGDVTTSGGTPNATSYIYNSGGLQTVLMQNAKAYIVIYLGENYVLTPYSKMTVEVRTSVGAALTIQRVIPGGMSPNTMVNLG
jgi:flagellin FlaB